MIFQKIIWRLPDVTWLHGAIEKELANVEFQWNACTYNKNPAETIIFEWFQISSK